MGEGDFKVERDGDGTFESVINKNMEQPDKSKVAICHIPHGNPANSHTLFLPEPAIKAHLGHGDKIGECEEVKKEDGQKVEIKVEKENKKNDSTKPKIAPGQIKKHDEKSKSEKGKNKKK